MVEIKRIIEDIYELEGLMREIEYRGEDTPSDLLEIAVVKSRRIKDAVASMAETCTAADVCSVGVVTPAEDETATVSVEPVAEMQEPAHASVSDDSPQTVPVESCQPCNENMCDTSVGCVGAADAFTPQKRHNTLRRMFSINDLFRFRRELFGNSDADMSEVLGMIDAMKEYVEAEEYFYGYLCWPRDNETVADFMAVIQHYFYNGR